MQFFSICSIIILTLVLSPFKIDSKSAYISNGKANCLKYVHLLSCTFKRMFIQICGIHDVVLLSYSLVFSCLAVKAKPKNIRRKFEFCETSFCNGANFNNFRRIYFHNVRPKSWKQIPKIFFLVKICPLEILPVR